ncbi:hypothetical protein F4861DRAFT_546224 [Xylaria intraflava]|nr:hypothetical protein F4861DRAFT_546224 [Xylaria intraflava]
MSSGGDKTNHHGCNQSGSKHSQMARATTREPRLASHSTQPPNPQNGRETRNNGRDRPVDLPDGGNCSTKWTDLPPDCTYEMLFDSIQGVGAVSHASIAPFPTLDGTSVARVEFFERESVVRLMAKQIRVGDREPCVKLDGPRTVTESNQVPPEHGNGGRGSRVIQVVGDPRVVQEGALIALLSGPRHSLVHGLEGVYTDVRRGLQYVEFRFAAFAGLAKVARDIFAAQQYSILLSDLQRLLWATVVCFYVRDPCE